MGLPDQPPAGPGWERWRGATDQKLTTVVSDISDVKTEQKKQGDTLSGMPAAIVEAIKNGEETPAPGNGQPVTFKWVTEKFLLPIVLLIASLIIAAAVTNGLGG